MRRLLLLASVAMICLPGEGAARADKFNEACTSTPRHLWLSLQALETKVEAQGYKVEKSRLTSTCAAFEAVSEDGIRVELFIDPTNGEIKGRVRLELGAEKTAGERR